MFESSSCFLPSLALAIKWACGDIGERGTLTHMNAGTQKPENNLSDVPLGKLLVGFQLG